MVTLETEFHFPLDDLRYHWLESGYSNIYPWLCRTRELCLPLSLQYLKVPTSVILLYIHNSFTEHINITIHDLPDHATFVFIDVALVHDSRLPLFIHDLCHFVGKASVHSHALCVETIHVVTTFLVTTFLVTAFLFSGVPFCNQLKCFN